MLNLPTSFLNQLLDSKKILLVGAGGGFDVLSLLPIYHTLAHYGEYELELANYSFVEFTELEKIGKTEVLDPDVLGATSEIIALTSHYPEGYLSLFFKNGFDQDKTVWMINRNQTIFNLAKTYERMIRVLQIDTIIACGFGQRSIMFGNEELCGDMLHTTLNIGALSMVEGVKKFVVTYGLETSPKKPVSYYNCLENIATINEMGGFYGGLMVEKNMPGFLLMKSAFEFIIGRKGHDQSALLETIIMGTEGGFGEHTSGGLITPIMSQMFFFDLDTIASLNLIKNSLETATGPDGVSLDYYSAIQHAMHIITSLNQRPYTQLPI